MAVRIMSEPTHGSTQAFIVRIWYEETGDEEVALVRRGSVEHVGSRERRFFHRLEDVLPILEELAGPPPAGLESRNAGEAEN